MIPFRLNNRRIIKVNNQKIIEPTSPMIHGIKYIIKNNADHIQSFLVRGDQWNSEILNILIQYISTKKLKHFLNIGSHIGTVCLPISKYIQKVTAIEAYPPTFNYLCENIRLNNITNVSPINIAVGNTEGPIYFMSEKNDRIASNTGGMHVFTENDIANNIRSSSLSDKKITGKMNKFDNLDIDNFDIVLIDIEGCEYDFLQGSRAKLLKNKPIIIIEIWDNSKRRSENMNTTQEDIINYIISLGYVLIRNIGDDFIFEPRI